MIQTRGTRTTGDERPDRISNSGRFWAQSLFPIQDRKGSEGASADKEGVFITIDDLIRLANELVAGLNKLGAYKHPLDVRRGGREEVVSMPFGDESTSVKAGAKTYFFDVKSAADSRPYLVITESRFKGKGKDRERASIVVFPEFAQEFLAALQAVIRKLG